MHSIFCQEARCSPTKIQSEKMNNIVRADIGIRIARIIISIEISDAAIIIGRIIRAYSNMPTRISYIALFFILTEDVTYISFGQTC
jgi:hypothetical protein